QPDRTAADSRTVSSSAAFALGRQCDKSRPVRGDWVNGSSVTSVPSSMWFSYLGLRARTQRYESDIFELDPVPGRRTGPLDQNQPLVRSAHRGDQARTHGAHHNAGEGGAVLEALHAVAEREPHPTPGTALRQVQARLLVQAAHAFDRIDLGHELGQHGGLVAAAGADLQDLARRAAVAHD